MNILSIFHTGGLAETLTALGAIGVGYFWRRAYKAHNSGWQQDTLTTGHTEGPEKIPYKKIPETYFALAIFVLWLAAIISVAIDYKGV